MDYQNARPSPIGRIWQYLLEMSEVAVAAHYSAPWRHTGPGTVRERSCVAPPLPAVASL